MPLHLKQGNKIDGAADSNKIVNLAHQAIAGLKYDKLWRTGSFGDTSGVYIHVAPFAGDRSLITVKSASGSYAQFDLRAADTGDASEDEVLDAVKNGLVASLRDGCVYSLA